MRRNIKWAVMFVLVCVAVYYITSPASLSEWAWFKGLVILAILVVDEIYLAIARSKRRA